MTIEQAVAHLLKQKAKHGNVAVYFDCPKCGQSFAPNTVVATAVHITETKKVPDGD